MYSSRSEHNCHNVRCGVKRMCYSNTPCFRRTRQKIKKYPIRTSLNKLSILVQSEVALKTICAQTIYCNPKPYFPKLEESRNPIEMVCHKLIWRI